MRARPILENDCNAIFQSNHFERYGTSENEEQTPRAADGEQKVKKITISAQVRDFAKWRKIKEIPNKNATFASATKGHPQHIVFSYCCDYEDKSAKHASRLFMQ